MAIASELQDRAVVEPPGLDPIPVGPDRDVNRAGAAGRYDDAYDALCPALRRQETADQFADRVADEPSISGYDMRTVSNPSDLVLPVDVRYADGTADTLRFRLEQDVNTGEFEVCGIDR